MTLGELTKQVDTYLADFREPRTFDESTVRKKLKEYAAEGLLVAEKRGKQVFYRRAETKWMLDQDALVFFSETAPCGVVGSFLADKIPESESHLTFKHHYITNTMDSEVLCDIFLAMRGKRSLVLKLASRRKRRMTEMEVVPLRIMISVQSGRQYLMAYSFSLKCIRSFRIDRIISVKAGTVSERFDELRGVLDTMLPHIWGVSTQSRSGNRMEHVEFVVRYEDDEQYIPRRLEREKRIGTVEQLDAHTSRFSADVYDASELIPWIRTFLCRIVSIHISNKELEEQFREDLQEMYALYGLEDDKI